MAVHLTGLSGGLERDTVDRRYQVRGSHEPDRDIVIVAVDQRTVSALGERPPISRRHYADLLDRLHETGARLVVVDVQFVGTTVPADDQALVDAIARDGPVVLATHDGPDGPISVPAGRHDVDGATLASAAVDTDADGVLRGMLYAPVELPTLPVVAARLLSSGRVDESGFAGNHAWIDYAGGPGTYPSWSMSDVLDGTVGRHELADRIVLVGITDPTQQDVFVTPMSSTPMAGVEVQANALATVRDKLPLGPAPGWLGGLALVILAIAPVLIAGRMPAVAIAGAGLVLLVVLLVAAQAAFDAGTIVVVSAPAVTLVLATAGAAASGSVADRRQREHLEAVLGSATAALAPTCFISYRRDQSGWPARSLRDGLVARFGPGSVFMDLDSIHAGQDFAERIDEAIRGCTAMLVLIGPYWLEARTPDGTRRLDDPQDWVRRELETALAAPDVRVVPVLLDGARMPDPSAMPTSLAGLARRNAVTVDADQWEAGLDALVASMQSGNLAERLRESTEGDPREGQ